MWVLLQCLVLLQSWNGEYAGEYEAVAEGDPLLDALFAGLSWLGSLLYFVLLIWMAVECARHDPDRWLWLWIILLFQPLGAAIYFFARWLPGRQVRLPAGLRRFTRGRELSRLEIAARQIGNPYQFVQWGDALRDVRKYAAAGNAYAEALNREADNLQALWGAALVNLHLGQLEPAEERLRKVLALDPKYKFGDASLEFGRTLCLRGSTDEAIAHFEQHLSRWRHPEALYLLAEQYVRRNETDKARQRLQEMLMDIDGSPQAIARKYTLIRSRARQMLRKLPRS